MASPRRQMSPFPRGPFAKTRHDHALETFEDYVEAIEDLGASHGTCRVCDLAAHMRVSHVTVIKTVARLTQAGLARKPRHGPVTLTPSGKRMASAARARHATVVAFLVSIGVPPAEAARDSEGIEHHCGAGTLAAMRRSLGLSERNAREAGQGARRPARRARAGASGRKAPS